MKKSILLIGLGTLVLSAFSCKSSKVSQATESSNTEVWTKGITTISGKIAKVTQEKDGQTVILYNNKGIEYTAVVSISNLKDNANQYRTFVVGESVMFKGYLIENQRMVVREILAMQ